MDEPAVPEPSPVPDFSLLGPLNVVVGDADVRLGGRRQSAVLGRLCLSPGLVVPMDELVESVWDGDVPNRPEVAVRSYVSNLRRSIEPGRDRGDRRSCIESVTPGYRLVANPEQFDYLRFESLLAEGRANLAAGESRAAIRCFDQASLLWRGEPGEGLLETDALLAFRSRMTELRLSALEHVSDARLALGLHEAVISDLESAIAAHPLRERLTELAMLALYQAGRQSDALTACRALHDRLLERLGVIPGRSIQGLEYRILNHDPTLMPTDPPSEAGGETRPNLAGLRREELAGRRSEFAMMGRVTGPMSSGRHGGSILVTGEPGSGKTSLVAEHCRTLNDVAVSWGHSRAVARSRPLWPWAQLLDGLAPWATAEESATIERLSERISAYGSSSDRLDREADVGFEPTSLFRPIVELVRRLSGRSALVIVLDDAHWADDASLELLAFAASALVDEPVAFIVAWRSTEPIVGTASSLRVLARLPGVTRIDLGPLDSAAVEALLEQAGAGHQDLAKRIRIESGGNAFFVAELVADAARAGAGSELSVRDQRDDLFEPVPTSNLEDSLLERLESTHELASPVAAVAGLHRDRFTAEVVAEAIDVAPPQVEAAFDALVRGGLIVESTAVEIGYRFVHPITATVAVGNLSALRRARLHAVIGHAMWRVGMPPADLAFHFFRAGSVGTSILAARFAMQWARSSTRLSDLQEIEAIVARGLETARDLDSSDGLEAELASFQAQVARARGRRATYELLARRAVQGAERSADRQLVASAALAATGPAVAHPDFSRAGWIVTEPLDGARSDDLLSSAAEQLDRSDPLRPVLALRRRPCRLDATQIEMLLGEAGDLGPVREWGRLLLHSGSTSDRLAVADWLDRTVPSSGSSAVAPDGYDRLLALRLRMAIACESGSRDSLELLLEGHRADLQQSDRFANLEVNSGADRGSDTNTDDLGALSALDLDRRSLLITADLLSGRLDRANGHLEIARNYCRSLGVASASFDRQLLVLRWEQGKFDEVADLADRPSTDLDPLHRQAVRALAAVGPEPIGADERGEAERFLGELMALPADPQGRSGVLWCMGALVANRLGDRDVAGHLSTVLGSWRHAVVTIDGGTLMLGLGSYFLGLALSTAGSTERSRRLLRAASDRSRLLGADSWLWRSLLAESQCAAAEGAPREIVDTYIAEAGVIAARIGAASFGHWATV